MTSERPKPEESIVLVHAYLDGELDVRDSMDVERAIAANGELAAEVNCVRALKRALQTLPQERVPPDLAGRIESRVGARRWARPTWTALAASVVISLGAASALTFTALRTADDRIYARSVDSHLRSLMAPRPVDLASTERHVVKPWFNGKSVQAPKVPDLSAQGFPLEGARIDVIDGSPVPAVVYKRRLHTISVWVANDGQASRLTRETGSVSGTNIVVWPTGGMTYWAASDLNSAELSAFAKAFAAAP